MPSGSDSRGPNKNSGAKSAKAIKAANKNSRPAKKGKGGVPAPRQIPWLSIGAGVAVLALIAVLGINLWPKVEERQALEPYKYSSENKDPSDKIDGVLKIEYPAGQHVDSTQRVAYDQTPPFGGPHDASWANCMGTVYDKALRNENAVHSLEHGAVWITYNPDKVDQSGIDTLKKKVEGEQYMLMSPHPDQEAPVSLQSWGHQLTVNSADDERVGQFITALRLNNFAYPEVGADCATVAFDTQNPPPYDPSAPGPDAVPMDGAGLQPDQSELGGMGVPGGGLPGGLPGGIPAIPGMPGTLPGQQAPGALPGQQVPGAGQ